LIVSLQIHNSVLPSRFIVDMVLHKEVMNSSIWSTVSCPTRAVMIYGCSSESGPAVLVESRYQDKSSGTP
jgi:hypothetical protein